MKMKQAILSSFIIVIALSAPSKAVADITYWYTGPKFEEGLIMAPGAGYFDATMNITGYVTVSQAPEGEFTPKSWFFTDSKHDFLYWGFGAMTVDAQGSPDEWLISIHSHEPTDELGDSVYSTLISDISGENEVNYAYCGPMFPDACGYDAGSAVYNLDAGQWHVVPMAASGDHKTYPGSICQAYYGDQESGIERHPSRGIGNYSDEYRWIVCPIIKDAVDEYGFSLDAWVYVQAGVVQTYCRLYASDPYGNTVDSDHGYAHGNDANIYLQTDQGHAYGAWGLLCRLPPDAVLHSYLVREHAGE